MLNNIQYIFEHFVLMTICPLETIKAYLISSHHHAFNIIASKSLAVPRLCTHCSIVSSLFISLDFTGAESHYCPKKKQKTLLQYFALCLQPPGKNLGFSFLLDLILWATMCSERCKWEEVTWWSHRLGLLPLTWECPL